MRVLHRPDGVHIVYEWENHTELRTVLEYLMRVEVKSPTVEDYERIKDIEAMIVARLGYLPNKRKLK